MKDLTPNFPSFEVDEIFVEVDERNSSRIAIYFSSTPSSDAYWSLSQEDFKRFANGCLNVSKHLMVSVISHRDINEADNSSCEES